MSRRRTGACAAVVWVENESRYRCGVVSRPADYLPRLPGVLRPMAARLLARFAHRFIAAGHGCDSDATLD